MDQRYVIIRVNSDSIAVKESYERVLDMLDAATTFISVTQILTFAGSLGSGRFAKAEEKITINKAHIALVYSNDYTKIQEAQL